MGDWEHESRDAAGHGDGDDFRRLLSEHAPAVLAWLSDKIPRRWQSVLSAEDALQQTCVDAFLHFERFVPHGEGAFRAWLIRIAQRNLLNALRSLEAQKRGGRYWRIEPRSRDDSIFALYEEVAAQQSTPSQHVAREEKIAAVKREVAQLPEDYRRVVEMLILNDQPVAEVAQAMERSIGAVYMVKARAFDWLAERLGGATDFFSRT